MSSLTVANRLAANNLWLTNATACFRTLLSSLNSNTNTTASHCMRDACQQCFCSNLASNYLAPVHRYLIKQRRPTYLARLHPHISVLVRRMMLTSTEDEGHHVDTNDHQASSSDVHATKPLLPTVLNTHRPRQRFEYRPLPQKDSIRLVRICSKMFRVECEIKIVRLSDNPRYKALSYCWGDCREQAAILCDGALFDVSSNLHKGLRELHYYSKTTETNWFWIDQISINQKDGAERNSQVRLMKDIYKTSEHTLIWLPLDERTARHSKSFLLDLARLVEAENRMSGTRPESRTVMINTKESKDTSPSVLSMHNDKRWASLKRLLESPWFGRCWVIQEVVLSRGSPQILCGKQEFEWHILAQFVSWIYANITKTGWELDIHFLECIAVLGEKEKNDDRPSEGVWDIQSLLYITRHFRATDPKDRIFSLLGLSRETVLSDQWPMELAPDYERHAHTLYTDVARYCIRQAKALSLLSQVYHEPKPNDAIGDGILPSWVPRWDQPQRVINFVSALYIIEASNGQKVLQALYNDASRGLPSVVDHSTSSQVLRTLGVRVDRASQCLPAAMYNLDDLLRKDRDQIVMEQLRVMPARLEECKRQLPHASIAALQRAFFMTITAGLTPEFGDASHEPLTRFRTFFNAILAQGASPNDASHSAHAAIQASLNTSTLMPLEDLPANGAKHLTPPRYSLALGALIGRRLFITASGALGLGPAAMAVDDVVVVLFGGNVPYVLRPVENGQWRFVGECYVHGIMKGEALQGHDPDARVSEWFDIV